MKTTIEMACKTKMPYDFVTGEPINLKKLEAFAALVREDEREKHKWDIHSCGPTCKRYACVAVREAVQAEREACAKVVDAIEARCVAKDVDDPPLAHVSAAIRARGTTPPQRPWVDLTDGVMCDIAIEHGLMSIDWIDFARAIESKLKEKNCG
jgi:hypothetical protein